MKKDNKQLVCAAAVAAGGIYLLSKKGAISGVGAVKKDFVEKYCGLGKSNKKAPYAEIVVAMQTGKYSRFHIVHFARGPKYWGYLPTPECYALYFLNDYDKAIHPEKYDGYPPVEFVSISRVTAQRLIADGVPVETQYDHM